MGNRFSPFPRYMSRRRRVRLGWGDSHRPRGADVLVGVEVVMLKAPFVSSFRHALKEARIGAFWQPNLGCWVAPAKNADALAAIAKRFYTVRVLSRSAPELDRLDAEAGE